MRNISAASLAKLATRLGTEPVCIIEVQWQKGGPISTYSDKATEGMQGRILELNALEDVINVSKSGTSQSVDITLDDTDGALKIIFNSVDIHKKKVWIYQWFTGIPLTDKILLFVGHIASPVVWKEGDRTLSFSVISTSEDHEVGFSPEEGSFPFLPQSMIGTAWPLIFGTVQKVPGILIDNIAYSDNEQQGKSGDGAASVTQDGTGIKDPSLDHRINDNDKNAANAAAIAQLYFNGYLLASFTARKRGELDEFDSIERGKGYFSGLAKQYLQQGNQKLIEAQKIRNKNNTLKTVKNQQEANEKKSIRVTNGDLFPQGKSTKLNLGGALHTGYFLGDQFHITARQHPQIEQYSGMTIEDPAVRSGLPVIPRQNYFFADAGIPLRMGVIANDEDNPDPINNPPLPVRYIVSATLRVTVSAVFAYRTVNERRVLSVVPFNYFSVFQISFGTLPVTMIWMPQPLSSRNFPNGESEGWDDEIWISCTSPVGPNTVDILIWLIQTYTGRTYDAASFNAVRTLLEPYPMHFALTDRPNVLSLISEIAYQARCIVWLKNDIFYIKYLAKEDPPVDTITEDDVLEQSMEISYTETEDLVTKYVAHWRADYKTSKNFAVILRYNVPYYGLLPKEYSFFCFNMLQLVQKAATFWMIREANTFKKLKITVPISKLKIETLDTVTVNFANPLIANGPVNCVVEEAKLNSADYTIDLTLWVPVRAGEMTKYMFAYMGDLSIGFYFPTEDDIQQGRVQGAGRGTSDVSFNDNVKLPEPGPAGSPDYTNPFSGDPGNGGYVQTTTRPHTWGVDDTLQTDLNQLAPEILQRLDATAVQGAGIKPPGTTQYQYDAQDARDDFRPAPITPRSYPGTVIEQGPDSDAGYATYSVSIFQEGFGGSSRVVDNVQFVGDKEQQIDPGTGVVVTEVFKTLDDGTTDITYYMQISTGGAKVYPGYVQGGNSSEGYDLETWPSGFNAEPDFVSGAIPVQINEEDEGGDEIEEGTGVVVMEIQSVDENEEPVTEYYFYVGVWQ
jgi:hypothetical protein